MMHGQKNIKLKWWVLIYKCVLVGLLREVVNSINPGL